ncbi:TAXI family TRAP transporter solute-binding subunit [Paracoccus sp. Z330]|uniref:TAXI family TRAP transporter solute-binding subunit n=1 Tax=Paracoccus onchidii TaxID=3017813 RepID=A0ABT4ZEY4_9RHOB|nr:TAXI family TRAP transporter solute-binding subunit [Paracoccus onchidii]MDB6177286.1 TAXI family TRAP transporter solute-binding subunit [Paracoccus onchidii]
MRLPKLFQRLALAAGLAGLPLIAAHAQEPQISIMTGSATGTYIQFGRDMQRLMGQCGHEMDVVESAGSLENFLGVRQRPRTQFGIVQNDVLEYMQTFAAQDPDIARTIKGVRIAFPLYEEEVHILAKNDLQDFRDLAGKRVAIGTENSGTFLTASLMLSLAGLEPAEKLAIAPRDALQQLLTGRIDAFFYVAGAPASLYTGSGVDGSKFHLLPITDDTLRSVYTPSTLAAGTYQFQSDPVDLVAVKAILMTYDYDATRNAYHKQSCDAVSDLSSLISGNLESLKQYGHPKWNDVDLGAIPSGWDVGACVTRGTSSDYQMNCTAPTTTDSDANESYRRSICAVMGC